MKSIDSDPIDIKEDIAKYQARQIEAAIGIAIEAAKEELKTTDLATKQDIFVLTKEVEHVKQNVEQLRLEIDLKIAQLRYDTLKCVIWTGVGVVIARRLH